MYEQDYIMRIIKEMIRTILKLLFNIDMESPDENLLQDVECKEKLDKLRQMLENGDINGAESMLYTWIDKTRADGLMTGILFYYYLNEKSDAFLGEHGFSRDEVKQGLSDWVSGYGIDELVDEFLQD